MTVSFAVSRGRWLLLHDKTVGGWDRIAPDAVVLAFVKASLAIGVDIKRSPQDRTRLRCCAQLDFDVTVVACLQGAVTEGVLIGFAVCATGIDDDVPATLEVSVVNGHFVACDFLVKDQD